MEIFTKPEPNEMGSVTVISGLNPQQTLWLKEAVSGTKSCLQKALTNGDDVETEHLDFLAQLEQGLKTTDEVISERSSEEYTDEYTAAPV